MIDFDPLKIIEIFKSVGDTKTAWIVGLSIIGGIAWKARGWKESLSTKNELSLHKKTMYEQSLIFEGNVSGTLQRLQGILEKHMQDDSKRFEELDHAWIPQLKSVNDKINLVDKSLARIEGALKIERVS